MFMFASDCTLRIQNESVNAVQTTKNRFLIECISTDTPPVAVPHLKAFHTFPAALMLCRGSQVINTSERKELREKLSQLSIFRFHLLFSLYPDPSAYISLCKVEGNRKTIPGDSNSNCICHSVTFSEMLSDCWCQKSGKK